MYRILHVEPSEFFTTIAKEIIKAEGHDYVSTNSYNDALMIIREEYVDLLMLSLEGDGMSNEEFIKMVKEIDGKLPICVVSSNKMDDSLKGLMNLGVVQYIYKKDLKNRLAANLKEAFKYPPNNEILKEASIAIIDDSHMFKLLLKDTLNKYKFEKVKYFSSGSELDKSGERFQIYLVDIILKNEFGKNVISNIREANKEALIIGITGLDNPEVLADIVDNGADDIIVKPIEELVLISKLKSYLRRINS